MARMNINCPGDESQIRIFVLSINRINWREAAAICKRSIDESFFAWAVVTRVTHVTNVILW